MEGWDESSGAQLRDEIMHRCKTQLDATCMFHVISAYMTGKATVPQAANKHCQQLIVSTWNHLKCNIEVDLRALLGGVTCATIVTLRVCLLYRT